MSTFVGQLNVNCVVFNFYRVGHDILARRTAQDLPGTYVELREVPGTGEHVAFKLSVVEGSTDVRAVIGKRVNSTLDPRQTDQFAIDFNR